MVRVQNDYPKIFIVESDTPHQVCNTLKTKCSVSKNLQDFTNLDKERIEFKVIETSADPDKMFAILDENSKKLKEFSARHQKGVLQILSKLEVAITQGIEYFFTLLNANEEHKKGAYVQLTTAKRMIKFHYEIYFAVEEG